MAIKAVPTYSPTLGRLITTAPKKAPVTRAAALPAPAVRSWANVLPTRAPAPAGSVSYAGQLAAPVPSSAATTQTTPGPTRPVPLSAVPGNYEASLEDILGHPLSQQALGSYNTQMQTLMRALRSNLGGQIAKSGYDPTQAFQQLLTSRPDLGEFNDLIDPTSIAAANANPLSEKALTEQAYSRGMSNLDYSLAARGIEGSGAQVTGGNQVLQTRQLAENQSRANLLNAIQGGIGDYVNQKASGYNRLQDVYSQVAQLLAQREGAVPVTGEADVEDQPNTPTDPVTGTNVPSAATPPSSYISWGGQQIRNVNQMRQWLAQHGGNWTTWASQHPGAAQTLVRISS